MKKALASVSESNVSILRSPLTSYSTVTDTIFGGYTARFGLASVEVNPRDEWFV